MSTIDCANPPCTTSAYNTHNLNRRSLQQSTLDISEDFSKILRTHSINTRNVGISGGKNTVMNPGANNHRVSNNYLDKRSLQQPTQNISDDFRKVLRKQSNNIQNLAAPGKKGVAKNIDVNNYKILNDQIAKDGTNLAIKKLAMEMEHQLLASLWNSAIAASGQNYEGGLGEEIFSGELINEVVKSSQGDKMSDIAQRLYDEAIKVHKANNGN